MADGIVGEFFSLKEQTDADLLAMQCGDFYEFFAEDAETVAEELDLKISQKSSHGSAYPMAGVPVDDLTPYLKALVERGYRVAVADQYEAEQGHAREITRVVTPGTVLNPDDEAAQYLAAVVRGSAVGTEGYGLAFAETTTGEFVVTTADSLADARAELYRFDPAEVLPGPEARTDNPLLGVVRDGVDGRITLRPEAAFGPGRSRRMLDEQFGERAVEAVGIESRAAIAAGGAVLEYIDETGAGIQAAMTRLRTADPEERIRLDATTQRNLELTETMHGDSEGSLLATIDHTGTAAGSRLLREWITRPRRDREGIERRLDTVSTLANTALPRERLRETLSKAADLERLATRAMNESADAQSLRACRDTLALLPELANDIDGTALAESPVAEILARPDHESARELHQELETALIDDPSETAGAGGLIRQGYDEELDEIIGRHEEVLEWLDGLPERVKQRHGLRHVSVGRNKTDGYYVQVGKSEADAVPEHFRQIKTLKNSKRFVTDELEAKEREALRLEEAREDLEQSLFADLRDTVGAQAGLLQTVGGSIAELDALAALAEHAAANDWVRPSISDDRTIQIEAGRHPVVEQTTDFVPNSLLMDRSREFLIVTGPNMSGKSTYMRQCALILLLAAAGSFVPAETAQVPLVDGVFTRVGALDELSGGRSTFMVEMEELSRILNSATKDSFVVLDEVGRGTATYDGVAIAWAATEYLHNEVGAWTLFATHYHELTGLADRLDRVHNVHMAAEERAGDVTFLWSVEEGPGNRSYGVHVAELAGVPEPVVDRASDVLDRLRADEAVEVRGSATATEPQQVVFDLGEGTYRGETSADGGERSTLDPATEAVLDELREVDLTEHTPIELMTRVKEWQARLDDE